MLKNLINYLKYSGVWMGIILNPFHWSFQLQLLKPTDMDPQQHGLYANFGPFWIRMVIDNGTY